MANLHLVTGFAGTEHITAMDQGAFNAALIGTGQFVLDKGSVFEAQVISNNQVRVLDGELMMQGRFVRLNPNTCVDLTIDNGEQGKLRNDLIVARYTKDTMTGVESVNLVVIKGEAVNSNPVDPEITESDITNGEGVLHDFPIWRLPLDGLNVGEPVSLFGEPFMDSMRTLPVVRKMVMEIQGNVDAQLAENDRKVDEKLDGFDGFKVGDTLTTVRTDLGDKWLLCNGEGVSASEYPALSEKLNSRYAFVENGYVNIKGFDGTYYAGFNYNNVPVYSTSPAGPWTPIPFSGSWGTFGTADVRKYGNLRFFDDGYWYCLHGTGFVRTNDITSGVWEKSAAADPIINGSGDFTVINGEIIHIGYYEHYSAGEFYRLGMSRGTIAGGMTLQQFSFVSYDDLRDFVFDNDYAYFVYCYEGNSYYGSYFYKAMKLELSTGSNVGLYSPSYEHLNMIDAGENLIVRRVNNSYQVYWTLVSKSTMEAVKSFSVADPNQDIRSVVSLDGVGMIQISDNDANKFIVYEYPEIGGGYTMQEYFVSFTTDLSVVGFSRWNDGTVDSLTGMFINNVSGGSHNGFYRAKALPSISVDGAYAYIRAKE